MQKNMAWLVLAVGASAAAAHAGGPYPRAGWSARLSTLQHGVSGRVTIVDENTLELSQFNYDGAGLAQGVFVYLGASNTQTAFVNGLRVGPDLRRAGGYSNETFTVDLPAGMTLDGWNAVAIWCVTASANFGSGTFAAPCPGDITGDGLVGVADLAFLLGAWGPQSSAADLSGDGMVNSVDLGLLLGAWGPCP